MGYSGDGFSAINAQMAYPTSVFVTGSGELFIADTTNNVVRKVDAAGRITTVAGNGLWGYSGDGGKATDASLKNPTGIHIDLNGNLFIADLGNNRVRKVDPAGRITTVAGNGKSEVSKDGGAADQTALFSPYDVYVNASGQVFVAELSSHRIRKVRADGKISTLAGTTHAGDSGDDGPAAKAKLRSPIAVTGDSAGNIYFSDFGNHRIRKVDPFGTITTVAGNGQEGYTGSNDLAIRASLNRPRDVFVDPEGMLYIADSGNHVIRTVDYKGVIRTFAGTGREGRVTDNIPADTAKLNTPSGVYLDAKGSVFIADRGNHAVRMVMAPLKANAGPDAVLSLRSTLSLAGAASGGTPPYRIAWTILSGPVASPALLSSSTALAPRFTPPAGGEYRLQLTVTDAKQQAASDTVLLTVIDPLTADAGSSFFAFLGQAVSLQAKGLGGRGPYAAKWSIRSGPNVSASQLSSATVLNPTFVPAAAGSYVLELTVGDSAGATASDSISVLVLHIGQSGRVVVTDDEESLEDLSHGEDRDADKERGLAIRWIVSPDQVNPGDIKEVHVYTRVDDAGDYKFLVRLDDKDKEKDLSCFVWNKQAENKTLPEFKHGPQEGHSYRFKVYLFSRSGSPVFYGPFENAGPVRMGDDSEEPTALPTTVATEPTATVTPPVLVDTPTVAPTPEATPTQPEEPAATVPPGPGATAVSTNAPESTPLVTVEPTDASPTPTATPYKPGAVDPTATPFDTPTFTATPTATPTATSMWFSEIPTSTPLEIPPTATATNTFTPIYWADPTATREPEPTKPISTATPTTVPAPGGEPSDTPTAAPTAARTPVPTNTPSGGGAADPALTPTFTPTATDTPVSTGTPDVNGNPADATATPEPTLTPVSPTPVPQITRRPTHEVPNGPKTPTPTPTLTSNLTPMPEPSAAPTGSPEAVPSPTAEEAPSATATTRATVTATPTETAMPEATPTVESSGPTATPNPLDTVIDFNLGMGPEGFYPYPNTGDIGTGPAPTDGIHPEATDGDALVARVPVNQLLTVNGPSMTVWKTPVRLSLWYRAPTDCFAIGLGAYVSHEGQPGGAVYTLRFAPELAPGVWQRAEIEIGADCTDFVPFVIFFNSGEETDTAYVDNLRIVQGAEGPAGAEIVLDDWEANRWLNGSNGKAIRDGNIIHLHKEKGSDAVRMVAGYTQTLFPNRVSVEIEVEKNKGTTGVFTLWLGNGFSTFQTDIPLRLLPEKEKRTFVLSGITFQPSAIPMFVVVQTAGTDDQQVTVTNVRVFETLAE